ncbi:MAG: hypothetical protein WDA60_06055 [Acidimicrobiia bacterium]|jgi:dienelactone hydrolase
MRPRAALVAIVVAVGAVAAACTPPPPPPPDPVSPMPVSRSNAVSGTSYVFTDTTRPTPAFGAYPGDAVRTLPTTVWYPTDRTGPYPLVVFAHGFAVDPAFYRPLLKGIAAAGYVVVAPTLPLLSGRPAGPTDTVDWDAHFGDLQFVTSAVLDRGASGDPVLGGLIDPQRIAVAGHSDGALLAFGDALEAGRTDARVRAVIAYAAYLGGGAPYQANGRALLHFASENDEYNDFAETVDWDRAVLGDPSWTVAVWGAGHAPPYTSPADPAFAVVLATTIDFLDFRLKAQDWQPFANDVYGNPGVVAFVRQPI